jgi:hypothetical protein
MKGLSAAHTLQGLDQFFLPGRWCLLQELLVEVLQELFQAVGRRLHGLGVVALFE